MSSKLCSHCQQTLPLSAFTRHPTASQGVKHTCRECSRAAVRGWQRRRREAGPVPAGYTCPICLIAEPRGGWHLDHDHKTGEVRGWLCRACNIALGQLKDDPEVLDRAYAWITATRLSTPIQE